MKKLPIPILLLALCAAPCAQAQGVDGLAIYKAKCATCHASHMMKAPMLGDKQAWAPIIAQGMEVIMQHATKGLRGMPPRGGTSLPDAELRAAVEYMVSQGK